MFVLASSGKFDETHVAETTQRRAAHYDSVLRRTAPETAWDDWLVSMCIATAPISAPRWLPMREVVELITLGRGARGVRSLFTSKPSERQVQQTTDTGRVALRFMTAVLSSGRAMNDEQRLLRECFVRSLALADDVTALLLAEPSATIEAIEVPEELDPKATAGIARGTWEACLRDGLDPVEDALAAGLCARLGLDLESTDQLRRESKAQLDSSRAFGAAAVDAIRYVLSDDPQASWRAGAITARLAVPPVHRAAVMLALEQGDQVVLAKGHPLEREEREACLSLAWLAACGTDPSLTRAAELAVRHDRVATDLGLRSEGEGARAIVERLLREHLLSAVQSAGL